MRFVDSDKRVDFIVAGVQKSGTTSLDRYLRQHANILMPKNNRKEVHYFDDTVSFKKGESYYHSLFPMSDTEKLWGECTPIYIYWNPCVERIAAYNPDVKIILLLRNPITRAFSHWNMEYNRHKREKLAFLDALKAESSRLKISADTQHRIYSYVDRGRYCKQIENLWSYIDRDRTLILKAEDLFSKPANVLEKVFRFLELPSLQIKQKFKLYSGEYRSSMSTEEYAFLLNVFKQEIGKLEKLLGWDCSDWLNI
jgi:hypothetical protein